MAKETPGTPEQQQTPDNPVRQIVDFLGSMQLGIILLLILAVVSIYATLTPYETVIDNVYHTWWFLGIMGFASLNLLLCTVERIGPLKRQALNPNRVMKADTIRKMQVSRAFNMKHDENAEYDPLDIAASAFNANGLKVSVEEGPEGTTIFGERGKYGYFGSIVTHLSLLLILLGAMYGGLTGFEARNGGWAGGNFFVQEGNFRVDIHDVTMVQEDDPTVRPRVYTDMTVSRGGSPIYEGTVAINEPARFEGTTIYHSTFMYLPIISVRNLETGEEQSDLYFEGDRVAIDDQGNYIQIMQFFPNFSMRPDGTPVNVNYDPQRPVTAGILVENGQRSGSVFMQINEPEIIETAAGEIEVMMTDFDVAAVFSIAKNLGRPWLFIGSVLMVVGLYMSFFLFPRRFYAVYDEKKSQLLIGGRGYRNRLGIEQVMERIETEIQDREEE
ncbi:cytochrome c biogenesis protein ResB [Dethiobacter alkaliphilus]|uniref:cytochrome c biogenesis protein ResB n=1 Tax=Dethiobacter alkaliphilus TaxID=427926 RepID=UPI002226399F|nr:cytochrome c biogenesis protein ResB [Dethiobacter alkaliphilus]MCW3491135.1 cytochrome c biogenesis protein ResB [Dethiobacter alkaliphilus]